MTEDGLPEVDWDSLTFSFTETDRMYIATCKQGDDWGQGKMQDFQNLSLSPAAGVINYGQGLFEGMKAQHAADGSIVLFRPQENARRSREGARRLGMTPVPEEMFLNAIMQTVRENSRWVPPMGKGAFTSGRSYSEAGRYWESHLPQNTLSWSTSHQSDRTSREE